MTDALNLNENADIDLAHEGPPVSDTFVFVSSEDADASGPAVDDDMDLILAGAEPIDTLLIDLEDGRVVDDPAQSADEAADSTHTFYAGYVAVAEDG